MKMLIFQWFLMVSENVCSEPPRRAAGIQCFGRYGWLEGRHPQSLATALWVPICEMVRGARANDAREQKTEDSGNRNHDSIINSAGFRTPNPMSLPPPNCDYRIPKDFGNPDHTFSPVNWYTRCTIVYQAPSRPKSLILVYQGVPELLWCTRVYQRPSDAMAGAGAGGAVAAGAGQAVIVCLHCIMNLYELI